MSDKDNLMDITAGDTVILLAHKELIIQTVDHVSEKAIRIGVYSYRRATGERLTGRHRVRDRELIAIRNGPRIYAPGAVVDGVRWIDRANAGGIA